MSLKTVAPNDDISSADTRLITKISASFPLSFASLIARKIWITVWHHCRRDLPNYLGASCFKHWNLIRCWLFRLKPGNHCCDNTSNNMKCSVHRGSLLPFITAIISGPCHNTQQSIMEWQRWNGIGRQDRTPEWLNATKLDTMIATQLRATTVSASAKYHCSIRVDRYNT